MTLSTYTKRLNIVLYAKVKNFLIAQRLKKNMRIFSRTLLYMGLISEIEGMWDFAHMGDCGGENEPIGLHTKSIGFESNNNALGGI